MSTTNFTNSGTMYLGTVTIDLSHADISGHYEAFDVSAVSVGRAHAQIDCSSATIDLSGIFWFKSDSIDVSNADISTGDLRFAYNHTKLQDSIGNAINNFNADVGNLLVYAFTDASQNSEYVGRCDSINIDATRNHAGATRTENDGSERFGDLGTLTIGISGAHYGALPGNGDNLYLAEDIARFIAFKLTGGYSMTDIFSNEAQLKSRIRTHLNDASNGVIYQLKNNLVPDSVGANETHDDFYEWEWGTSLHPTVAVGNGSPIEDSFNLTEAVIAYMRNASDLGQYLVNQAVHAYDHIDNAYGINKNILDASGQATAVLPWTPLTITREIKIAIKLVFNNIAASSHSGAGASGGPGDLAGGNNVVGSRSYMITMSDGGVTIDEIGVGDDTGGAGGDNVA